MPIRKELLAMGLSELVEQAKSNGWKTLWQPVEDKAGDTEAISQQFSQFWAGFARNDLKITDTQKVLYSFRHSFKDAIGPAGASDDEKKHLMGHAETGSTKGYGTKREPKPVDIVRLNQIVQGVEWAFLAGLCGS